MVGALAFGGGDGEKNSHCLDAGDGRVQLDVLEVVRLFVFACDNPRLEAHRYAVIVSL